LPVAPEATKVTAVPFSVIVEPTAGCAEKENRPEALVALGVVVGAPRSSFSQ
jgi:hypothetical protein